MDDRRVVFDGRAMSVIDGILRLDPMPERVMFDTRQDERGAMKVQEGTGGG